MYLQQSCLVLVRQSWIGVSNISIEMCSASVQETFSSQSLTQRAENLSCGLYLGSKCKTGKPHHFLTPYSVIRPAYYY